GDYLQPFGVCDRDLVPPVAVEVPDRRTQRPAKRELGPLARQVLRDRRLHLQGVLLLRRIAIGPLTRDEEQGYIDKLQGATSQVPPSSTYSPSRISHLGSRHRYPARSRS